MAAQVACALDVSTMVGTTKHHGRNNFRVASSHQERSNNYTSWPASYFRGIFRIFKLKEQLAFFIFSFLFQTLRATFLCSSIL
jgi:hypothetical protein